MSGNGTTRNLYQRKLAVMAKCSAIVPDKVHPHHKFPYVSVQNVSNSLRTFAVEEGLDITVAPNEAGDRIVVVLTNADDPDQFLTRSWPLVDGDKAWSYTCKYALIRMFLIGDGEEGDEAKMADASAAQSKRNVKDKPKGEEAKPANGRAAEPTPVNVDKPPSAEAYATLVLLAANLPATPKEEEWVAEQIAKHGYAKVLDSVRHQHRGQCKEDCEHVQSQPSLLPDTAEVKS